MTSSSGVGGFVSLVYEKAADDNIFFLASGMTFSILLAAIPYLLLALTAAGVLIAPQFEAPQSRVLEWFWTLLPVSGAGVRLELESLVQEVADRAGSIGVLSGLAFVWLSTRLFGALRTVLAEVFDLDDRPSVVRGKVMDVGMVLVSTVLMSMNVVLTSLVSALGSEGIRAVGFHPGTMERALGLLVAFLFIWLMFLLIYKMVSLNRVRWRTAALAALLAATGFELVKVGFGWWVVNFADYASYFFTFGTLVVLVISIYYGSVLFVLGGEVAQVVQLRRTLRAQREMFDTK